MFVLAGSLTSESEGQGIPGDSQRWGLLGGAQGGQHQREHVLRDAGLSGQPSGSVGRDREFTSLVVQQGSSGVQCAEARSRVAWTYRPRCSY